MANNLVIDISHWQVYVDYESLKLRSPVKGAVIKSGQGKTQDSLFNTHAQGFTEVGMPLAIYHWYDPYVDVKEQIELIRSQLQVYPSINLVNIDVEQFGWTYQNLPPYKTSAWLSNTILSFVTGIQTMGAKVGIYSRTSLIVDKFKEMISWLYDPRLDLVKWMASYPFTGTVVSCTWDVLMSQWAPKVFSPYVASGWPLDKRYFDAWQWSGDKFVLPFIKNNNGGGTAIDLNYFSDEALAKFTKSAVEPPPAEDEMAKLRQLINTVYYELVDLEAHNAKELAYIIGLVKPGSY